MQTRNYVIISERSCKFIYFDSFNIYLCMFCENKDLRFNIFFNWKKTYPIYFLTGWHNKCNWMQYMYYMRPQYSSSTYIVTNYKQKLLTNDFICRADWNFWLYSHSVRNNYQGNKQKWFLNTKQYKNLISWKNCKK